MPTKPSEAMSISPACTPSCRAMSCECRDLTLQQQATLLHALQTANKALWRFAHVIAALDNGAIFHGLPPLPDAFVLVAGEQGETLFDIGMLREAAEALRTGTEACKRLGAPTILETPLEATA